MGYCLKGGAPRSAGCFLPVSGHYAVSPAREVREKCVLASKGNFCCDHPVACVDLHFFLCSVTQNVSAVVTSNFISVITGLGRVALQVPS